MKKFLLRLLVLALFAFATPGVWAQVTTSAINGTITDPTTKETLIGATIVAKHLPTGTTYGAITNAKGNFSIVGMRPGGPYTLTVTYIGYQPTKIENVSLALGETETFNIQLKDDTQQLTSVVVTGSKGGKFNAQKTGAGTAFSRKNIERVPTVSRSLMDIAKLTPQSNGNGSFAGANSRFNSFQIDGAVNNDVFGLGASSSKNAISIEAIDALQVVIAPFDVRQSGFTGGGMNAITKSGTNAFHGSVYDFYHNQDFYGTTAGKDVKERKKLDKQYENTVGFTLGGPIVQDKLFFFANGEYVKQVNPSTYIPGDASSKITKEEADKVEAKLKSLGYDAGGYTSRSVPSETFKGLLRLDWNINQAHHLTMRYSYIDDKPYIFSNNPTTLKFYNSGYFKRSVTNTVVAELNSKLTSSISNELRVSYSGIRDKRSFNGAPFPFLKIDLGGRRSIQAGVDQYTPANELSQDIYSLSNNLTLSLGNHTLTFGTHNEFFRMRNLFIRDLYGVYDYRTYDTKDATGKTVPHLGIDDFLTAGDAGEIGPGKYNYSYVNTAATNGDGRWAPSFRAGQLGFYAQDDWKVSNVLRLTYGLRVDMPFFLDRPTANPTFNNSAFAKEHGVTNDYLPPLRPLFSPRVGFRYDVDADSRYVVRGGTGIFTGRVPFVWISNSFTNSGLEYLRTERLNQDARDHVRLTSDLASPKAKANIVPGSTEIDMVGSNFTYPQVWRTSLAFDARLPWGIRATLEGMYSKTLNNVRYQDLGLKKATEKVYASGEVRPVYKRQDADKFSNLILLSNSNLGYTYNLTATLAKDFGHGLDASIAYTFGEAKVGNDGLSSQASGNWLYNYSNDINGDEVYYSAFDMRHRVVAQLNYRVEYAKHFATTIGLIYNGQSGPRYSFLSYSDLNGDGEKNDLAYLPETATTDKKSAMTYEKFLEENPDIAAYKGHIIPRNALMAPFVNKFDLHFAQDFFLKVGGKRHTLQLNADIVNVGNLLNRAWGMTPRVEYSRIFPLSGANSENFTISTPHPWTYSDIASRWQAQVGLKYIF